MLLWLAPLFETLPRSCLSAIIVVALKGMLQQVNDLKQFYKESILDVLVWVITFFSVILLDIDIGLISGALISILVFYIKGLKSYSCMLGQIPNTDIYVDLKSHQNILELPNIKIYRYYGSVNFATSQSFSKNLFESVNYRNQLRHPSLQEGSKEENQRLKMQFLIIDLSSVPHIDISGYRTFLDVSNKLQSYVVNVYLASASDCVYDCISKAILLGEPSLECFATVHDAVLFAQEQMAD